MKKRKANRLKGYDYSKNNLYFVTCCVKNMECCLGDVVYVGTGRDLSVHDEDGDKRTGRDLSVRDLSVHDLSVQNPEIHPSEIHPSEIHPSEIHPSENSSLEFQNPEINSIDTDYNVALNEYGLIVDEKINWLIKQYEYVDIHNYVIMPNHFHFILEIDSLKVKDKEVKIKTLSSLMGALKTTSSNEIHNSGFEDFAWHRSFHDHIIRNENSYQYISNYIDLNPQKWFQDKFYRKD